MKNTINLPVFNITNFNDYNNCMEFDKNFYIRPFNDHVNENLFIESPHGHDFYLVLLITKGSGTHSIDYKEYDVEPGMLFIVSPGQVHCWDLSDDVDGYVMFFKKEYFLIDFNHDKLIKLPFFKTSSTVPCLKLDELERKTLADLYVKINEEYQLSMFNYHEMIRLYLNIMFIELSRIYQSKEEKSIVYSYDLIQLNQFETLINKHFKEHQSLNFYAEKMNISLKQLSYLCKKTVNKTPSEILLERIILEAKRFIIHSSLSISAISDELNYNDNSYFIRLFKKVCSLTPEQFRHTMRAHS
ncbi:AraC family transcriptional regulator [Algibacter sp.]|nr:AraC family transcriptional regulator [Algibacter sp.]MDA9069861.1 AraC family transcriptional regulator [Algibacter sp.]MDB4274018.1 AraC family transcriptional regulator [Algibacter sp.]MDC1276800.1 AraC family transcriptional regulator [Algibacter sp.]